jgi:hypothetical protein
MSSSKAPRRRTMDRRQLIEATRTIKRLVRSKTTVSRTPKPSKDLPEDHRQIIHLAVDKTDLANLEKIVERFKRDPLVGPMKVDAGREKAARYAIAWCAENGPARISATG